MTFLARLCRNWSSPLLLIAELAPDAPLDPTQVIVVGMLLMITGTCPGFLVILMVRGSVQLLVNSIT